jgi:diaminopimelate decarboxylase
MSIEDELKIIAEPGRFFPTTMGSFFSRIIGTKKTIIPNEDDEMKAEEEEEERFDYYLTDGAYGAIHIALYYQWDKALLKEEGYVPEAFSNHMRSFLCPPPVRNFPT